MEKRTKEMKRFLALCMAVIVLATGASTVYAENGSASANKRERDELVIVLDPGHDSTHAGANGNGVYEEKAVTRIALYLREELSKYENVKIYMTREGESCAFPDTQGMSEASKRCNEARVMYAKGVGADVIVSLHLNSFTSSSPNGVLAFVQNDNYAPELGKVSQDLGRVIVDKIAELGLSNEGIVPKGSAEDTKPEEFYYPDGSIADYYRVLRYAKAEGMPALIVEHAFLSNASDVAKVLSSEEGLKQLAIKDAEGIVEYYGLTLKEGCVAGELTNLTTIPQTQTKETILPNPISQPDRGETPEIEVETESEETTESVTETELTEEADSELETEEEIPTIGAYEPSNPWNKVAWIIALFIAGGIGGLAGTRNYLKKQSAMHKKDKE